MLPMVGTVEEARADRQSHEISLRPAGAAWRFRSRMTATGRARSPTSSPPPTSARRSSARSRRPRASRTPRRSRRSTASTACGSAISTCRSRSAFPASSTIREFTQGDRRASSRPAASTTRRSAAWCPTSQHGHRALRPGLRFHLLFRRCLGAAQRARRGDRHELREGSARRSRAPRRPRASDGRGTFRVALSGDFRKPTARRPIPISTWRRCARRPASRWRSSTRRIRIRAEQLEDFDALILLAHRFGAESVPKSGRLAVVARFGVGYDTVDVEACTEAGIAAGHHAGRRAPAGGGLDHHAHAGADRQADDQGPADPRGAAGLRQALRPYGRRAWSGARSARSASAISAPRCSGCRSRST